MRKFILCLMLVAVPGWGAEGKISDAAIGFGHDDIVRGAVILVVRPDGPGFFVSGRWNSESKETQPEDPTKAYEKLLSDTFSSLQRVLGAARWCMNGFTYDLPKNDETFGGVTMEGYCK